MTDNDLLQALRDCYDPLLRRNIVELRMVRSATLELDTEAAGANVPGVPPHYRAVITLRAPSSDDAAASQLVAQVENRLAGLPAISQTEVRLLPPTFPILSTVRD